MRKFWNYLSLTNKIGLVLAVVFTMWMVGDLLSWIAQ